VGLNLPRVLLVLISIFFWQPYFAFSRVVVFQFSNHVVLKLSASRTAPINSLIKVLDRQNFLKDFDPILF